MYGVWYPLFVFLSSALHKLRKRYIHLMGLCISTAMLQMMKIRHKQQKIWVSKSYFLFYKTKRSLYILCANMQSNVLVVYFMFFTTLLTHCFPLRNF